MSPRSRKARALALRKSLEELPKGVMMSIAIASKFRRQLWDLENPPFSELRRALYMETIGGFDWGRR